MRDILDEALEQDRRFVLFAARASVASGYMERMRGAREEFGQQKREEENRHKQQLETIRYQFVDQVCRLTYAASNQLDDLATTESQSEGDKISPDLAGD